MILYKPVVDHLKSLVIHLTTARHLVGRCQQLEQLQPRVEVFLVNTVPSTQLRPGAIREFSAKFCQHFAFESSEAEKIKTALGAFDIAPQKLTNVGTVHAEAQIMGAACSFWKNDGSGVGLADVSELLEVSPA